MVRGFVEEFVLGLTNLVDVWVTLLVLIATMLRCCVRYKLIKPN